MMEYTPSVNIAFISPTISLYQTIAKQVSSPPPQYLQEKLQRELDIINKLNLVIEDISKEDYIEFPIGFNEELFSKVDKVDEVNVIPYYRKKGYIFTSPYGYRINPVTHQLELHNGIDIAMPKNTQAKAILSGYVESLSNEDNDSRGKYITVRVNKEVKYSYYHLNHVMCEVGDIVKAGDVIGKVGSTGRSTGAHLHIAYFINNKSVNILEYYKIIDNQ